jgi:hypothetical protein
MVHVTRDTLTFIKSVAKRLAREQRLQHITGLELVAHALGQPHWRGLTEAWKRDWRPTQQQLDELADLPADYWKRAVEAASTHTEALSVFGDALAFKRWEPSDREPMEADVIHGELDGHPFYLVGDEFSVGFGSQGWEIVLDQPPSAKPEVRHLGRRGKAAAVLDPAFQERAIQLLRIRARRMHAEVAADWPRRATWADQEGRALHPLQYKLAAEWQCLHCDAVHSGRVMAANLWHCPACGAQPIDMFVRATFPKMEPAA